MCRIAILLAAYNGEDYLLEQLSSIVSLESIRSKIFFSDHNSADNTKSIFINFCEKNELDFKMIESPVPYIGAGQNFFHIIREVDTDRFDYFAFCDQDDMWLPKKLIHAVQIIKEYRVNGYSSSVATFRKGSNKIKYIDKYSKQKKYDYFFQSPGPGCTFVLSPKLFIDLKHFIKPKIELMNNIYYHDWFIYAFARHFNYNWFIDPISHIHYRQHDNNDTGASSSIYAKFKRFKLLWNNWAFDQALLISEVIGYKHKLKTFYKYYPINLLILLFTIRHYRRDFLNSIILYIILIFNRFGPKRN
jgi:rhamnosyltransferase